MASYKKKNIKKLQPSKEPRRVNIEMNGNIKSAKKTVRTHSVHHGLRVITGSKGKRKYGFVISSAIAIILAAFYSIFTLIHPIGVFEYLSSSYKTVGSGRGFPIELSGEEIVKVEKTDKYFYILNQTDLNCYNLSGKVISKKHHGLAKPVISISETRALLYGQGEKLLKIFNFDKQILDLQLEKEILSADIADNGNYAVATYADSYDSVVKVFNKNNQPIYEWYSASGIVNKVSLTANGNKLLVSTFTADDGIIKSKVYILNYKSADAENFFSFDNDIPYDIVPVSNNKFYVLFDKTLELIDTKRGSTSLKADEYSNRFFDEHKTKILLASTLTATDDKNIINLFDKKGKNMGHFQADFTVNDITFKDNTIFVLGNSEIIKLDRNGNILCRSEVSFDTKRIIPVSERYVIAISNSSINKITLKDGVN